MKPRVPGRQESKAEIQSTISLSLGGVTSIVSLPSYSPSISHDWDLTDLRTLKVIPVERKVLAGVHG